MAGKLLHWPSQYHMTSHGIMVSVQYDFTQCVCVQQCEEPRLPPRFFCLLCNGTSQDTSAQKVSWGTNIYTYRGAIFSNGSRCGLRRMQIICSSCSSLHELMHLLSPQTLHPFRATIPNATTQILSAPVNRTGGPSLLAKHYKGRLSKMNLVFPRKSVSSCQLKCIRVTQFGEIRQWSRTCPH